VAAVEAEQQTIHARGRFLYVMDKTVREMPQICRTRGCDVTSRTMEFPKHS
jgi:hypothetical protein